MMPEMILYLLKVNLALLLFYAGYHFILQRYTFHTLNRFYLLVALVYSALYPLIDLSRVLGTNQQLKEKISVLAPDWKGSITYIVNQTENGTGDYWQIVLLVFWLGVAFMSLRLIIQLLSLVVLHLQSTSFTLEKFKFRKISKTINPFSFWRTIYLNPECHEAAELRSILEHEQVHVKQLHTFDVLLAELSTIFYWFNPGVWLMKKAIKANLEFITDQEVINSGIDSKAYQYALLKSQVLPQNAMPVNNFHFLTIKKRIAMINKKPSSAINVSNYVLILPAIMLLVLLVGTSKGALTTGMVANMVEHLPAANVTKVFNLVHSDKKVQSKDNTTELNTLAVEGLNALNDVARADTDKIERPVNESQSDVKKIVLRLSQDTVKLRKEPVIVVNGRRATTLPKHLKDSIASITVRKDVDATRRYGAEGANGVIEITTKGFAMVNLRPKKVPGNIVGTEDTNPDQKVSMSTVDADIFILDGEEVSKATIDEMKVSTIGSIEILKGPAAIAKYGEKAKKGVVIVTSKK